MSVDQDQACFTALVVPTDDHDAAVETVLTWIEAGNLRHYLVRSVRRSTTIFNPAGGSDDELLKVLGVEMERLGGAAGPGTAKIANLQGIVVTDLRPGAGNGNPMRH
jgi:hypothetical protein